VHVGAFDECEPIHTLGATPRPTARRTRCNRRRRLMYRRLRSGRHSSAMCAGAGTWSPN